VIGLVTGVYLPPKRNDCGYYWVCRKIHGVNASPPWFCSGKGAEDIDKPTTSQLGEGKAQKVVL
jgi:hypothetical protein